VSWEQDYPEIAKSQINVLELKTVQVAMELWGPYFKGKHIVVRSDNTATVAAVNKCTSKSPELMILVRNLFWLSVKYDFRLTASFIPGRLNVLSDKISRLEDRNIAFELIELLSGNTDSILECSSSMSYPAFLRLQECWVVPGLD
jgi:hypothetical protein